ncbi:DNA-3-methyladenine glycosylase I [Nesterenkonia salmonea]|uniref:DNA-3-methyladenine glycosylase I n=2 Tax=Nesterenkonia salmonea TaxID=1804987 RepID=A0A5R9BA28_9MICC|nr:DNA-3-methyladenine glycosylase I [Nesterenkonia salmonea]TLP94079.1 DNA-3-methyladenine glycosylase I [Nesterenkonia salmonea]
MTSNAGTGSDVQPRCPWSAASGEMLTYHDTEWGFPVDSDQRLFEKLCLESFQSGLSWRTILHKRQAFRRAFSDFDIPTVARFNDGDAARLVQDASIVRNRRKIAAVIGNARAAERLIESEGSLAAFTWSYEPTSEETEPPQTVSISPASVAMSKELKRRGWAFLGPTTVFAFMQSMGLLNDHTYDCVIRPSVQAARTGFVRPGR